MRYVSLFEVLNMLHGIEDLMMEDDNIFLEERYVKIKNIYNESKIYGSVPKKYHKTVNDIDDEILEYIGVN